MLGKAVATTEANVTLASATITLNAANWLPGTYSAVIEKDGMREVVRLVKR
jgi:hypothetical protein